MGCPTTVELEDNLTFSVTTRTPSTSGVVDADSVPTYRVYEDETGTAILTGSMAKLDDTNTTGFYTETIACTAANGFEVGKSYTIYIEAVVGSVTDVISYGFKPVDTKTAIAAVSATLSTVSTNVSTLLTRIPAALFSGITSLANWLGAIAAKHTADGTAITEINATGGGSGTYTATTDSQEAIRDTAPLGTAMRGTDGAYTGSVPSAAAIADAVWDEAQSGHVTAGTFGAYLDAAVSSGGGATAAEVWAYESRTLTQSANTIASAVSGDSITVHRGDTWTITLTGLGDISTRSKLWFTVKDRYGDDTDASAVLMLEETDGLVYINGEAAGTVGNATVTVNNAVTGSVTFTIEAEETADIVPSDDRKYDVQILNESGVVSTLSNGVFVVNEDVTRRVS